LPTGLPPAYASDYEPFIEWTEKQPSLHDLSSGVANHQTPIGTPPADLGMAITFPSSEATLLGTLSPPHQQLLMEQFMLDRLTINCMPSISLREQLE